MARDNCYACGRPESADAWKQKNVRCRATQQLPFVTQEPEGAPCHFGNRTKRAQAFQKETGDAPDAAHWLSELSSESEVAVESAEAFPLSYWLFKVRKTRPKDAAVFLERHKSPKRLARALGFGSWILKIPAYNADVRGIQEALVVLRGAHPSTIAQSLTQLTQKRDHELWFRGLAFWGSIWTRHRGSPFYKSEYAVKRMSDILNVTDGDVGHFIDFIQYCGGRFNERWTADRLRREIDEWEAMAALLAQEASEERMQIARGFPEQVSIDGVDFTALTSEAALAIEGQVMRHCVGGYHRYVRAGKSVIYAVRGHEKKATLEIGINPDFSLGLSQIKGPRNVKPAKPLEDAARKLLEAVQKDVARERLG